MATCADTAARREMHLRTVCNGAAGRAIAAGQDREWLLETSRPRLTHHRPGDGPQKRPCHRLARGHQSHSTSQPCIMVQPSPCSGGCRCTSALGSHLLRAIPRTRHGRAARCLLHGIAPLPRHRGAACTPPVLGRAVARLLLLQRQRWARLGRLLQRRRLCDEAANVSLTSASHVLQGQQLRATAAQGAA